MIIYFDNLLKNVLRLFYNVYLCVWFFVVLISHLFYSCRHFGFVVLVVIVLVVNVLVVIVLDVSLF